MSIPTRQALWIFVISSVIAGGAPTVQAHSLEALEKALKSRERYAQFVNRPAPSFSLRSASGSLIRLSDFRGKVVVLWFVYTKCPDVCPLHSDALAKVQKMVNRTQMKSRVQFVAITTDPARDSPAILKSYGRHHALDSINWVMLTSGAQKAGATRVLARKYGLKFTVGKDGYQTHGIVTHLIDRSGNLRARYHGLKFDPANLIGYINALTNDNH